MLTINIKSLNDRLQKIKKEFNDSSKPFRYVVFNDFYDVNTANKILNEYPSIKDGKWNDKTYIEQLNKFQKTEFETGSLLNNVFDDLNHKEFLGWLKKLTDLEADIVGDRSLFGGGLHQSIKGAFLNVHVDYNIHPETKYHRRLNVLIYMNKDWKDEYEGHLELWNIKENEKNLLEKISPSFNKCVIFETNEVSYHGHPTPLNTPNHINRKSIATYYYTKTRPEKEISDEHNTIYINTQGSRGSLKKIKSSLKALKERLFS